MLTDEKRKKLLAGALAVVMLTGVAGCGNCLLYTSPSPRDS